MVDINYEVQEEIVCSVELYQCACCNMVINTDAFDYIFCSAKCDAEYEELGTFTICG